MPVETIVPLNQIDLYTQIQDLSSLESVAAIQPINANTNGQAFTCSSAGSALSSMQPPQVRTHATINEDLFEGGTIRMAKWDLSMMR